MRKKIINFILIIAGIGFILFAKHSMILFMGDEQYHYVYGFPFRCLVTTANNSVVHIYFFNIALNILCLFPMGITLFICHGNAIYRGIYLRFGIIFGIIFCLSAVSSICLPWTLKGYAFCGNIISYVFAMSGVIVTFILYYLSKYGKPSSKRVVKK